jgi:hypothetical protein
MMWLPCARFQGHSDVISGIGYLHALDCYITSSWDGALRMWKRPQPAAAAAGGSSSTGKPSSAAAVTLGEAAYLLPEDSEDAANYVSEYEKAHPLVMPKALSQVRSLQDSQNGTPVHSSLLEHVAVVRLWLTLWRSQNLSLHCTNYTAPTAAAAAAAAPQDHTLALLRAIGVAGDDGPSGSKHGGRRGGRTAAGRAGRAPRLSEEGSQLGAPEPPDAPGSLGAKLQELGRKLLLVSAIASR